jgi:hemolysin III
VWHITACAVFGVALVALYAASTLYHSFRDEMRKRLLRKFDHAAIFLLIAGPYTPFALGVLRGVWGWLLLGSVWSLAAFGVARTIAGGVDRPYRGTRLYLAMGWLIVLVIGPVTERMNPAGLWLIVAGGVAYTVGVAFYAARGLKFHHLIWHVFVLLGSACHVLAALWYSAA